MRKYYLVRKTPADWFRELQKKGVKKMSKRGEVVIIEVDDSSKFSKRDLKVILPRNLQILNEREFKSWKRRKEEARKSKS